MTCQDSKIKIWLDCDPGNDDCMAIIMALGNANLLGLSTVFGNNSIEKVTKNALRILCSLDRRDIPVYRGAEHSLANKKLSADCHGKEGMFGAEKLPLDISPSEESLYDLMIRQSNGSNFTLVMTGAQTNIALLLREHPEMIHRFDKVIFMGGSAGFGNVTPNAEFNIYADPLACQEVINSCFKNQIEIVMIALDLTHTVLVTDEIQRRIKEINSPFTDWCAEMMLEFAAAYKEEEFDFPPLHDPVAMYYALHPEEFKTRVINVEVETEANLCFGRTVCDMFHVLKKDRNVRFCEKVNLNKFWAVMIEALVDASKVAKLIP